jgi:hypothetical protein
VTHQLVAEFRQHRLLSESGDDVLALYETLYHAYASFPMLRQKAIAIAPNSPFATDTWTGGQIDDMSSPSHPSDSTMSFEPLADESAMVVDSMSPTVPGPSDSSKADSTMGVDHAAPKETPSERKLRKLQLRHENLRNRRRNVPLLKEIEKDCMAGIKFECPVCPVSKYFFRGGLVDHMCV